MQSRNRSWFSRRGRTLERKVIDPGFTIEPDKVEAYKEYLLINGLIRPDVIVKSDGFFEIQTVNQQFVINPRSGTIRSLVKSIFDQFVGGDISNYSIVSIDLRADPVRYNGTGVNTSIYVNNSSGTFQIVPQNWYVASSGAQANISLVYDDNINTCFMIVRTSSVADLAYDRNVAGSNFEISPSSAIGANQITCTVRSIGFGQLPPDER